MSSIPENLVGFINSIFPVVNSNYLNIHADPNNPECSYIVCPTRCNIKITYEGLTNIKVKNIRLENSTQNGNVVRRFVWLEVDDIDSQKNILETNFTSNAGMPQVQSEENRYRLKFIMLSLPSIDYLDSELYDGEIKFIHESGYEIKGETRKVVLSILVKKDLKQYQSLAETPKSFSFFKQFVNEANELIIPSAFQNNSKNIQFNPKKPLDLVDAIPRKLDHHDLVDMTYYTVQKTPSVVLFLFEKAIPIQAEIYNLFKKRMFTTDAALENYLKKRKDAPTDCPFNQFFYSDENDNIYASQLRGSFNEDDKKTKEGWFGEAVNNSVRNEYKALVTNPPSITTTQAPSSDSQPVDRKVDLSEEDKKLNKDFKWMRWVFMTLMILLIFTIGWIFKDIILELTNINFQWNNSQNQQPQVAEPLQSQDAQPAVALSQVEQPNLPNQPNIKRPNLQQLGAPLKSIPLSNQPEIKLQQPISPSFQMNNVTKDLELQPLNLKTLNQPNKIEGVSLANSLTDPIPDYSAGSYLQKLQALNNKFEKLKTNKTRSLNQLQGKLTELGNQSQHWINQLQSKKNTNTNSVKAMLNKAVVNLEGIRNKIIQNNNVIPPNLEEILDSQRRQYLDALSKMKIYSKM